MVPAMLPGTPAVVFLVHWATTGGSSGEEDICPLSWGKRSSPATQFCSSPWTGTGWRGHEAWHWGLDPAGPTPLLLSLSPLFPASSPTAPCTSLPIHEQQSTRWHWASSSTGPTVRAWKHDTFATVSTSSGMSTQVAILNVERGHLICGSPMHRFIYQSRSMLPLSLEGPLSSAEVANKCPWPPHLHCRYQH